MPSPRIDNVNTKESSILFWTGAGVCPYIWGAMKAAPNTNRTMQAKTTYVRGHKAEYTGTQQELYGATAYNLKLLEGPNKGEAAVTYKAPELSYAEGQTLFPR